MIYILSQRHQFHAVDIELVQPLDLATVVSISSLRSIVA